MSKLEDLFKGSTYNRNRAKYSGVTKLDVDISILNLDTKPPLYNTAGRLESAGDTSRLNIDVTPPKYNP